MKTLPKRSPAPSRGSAPVVPPTRPRNPLVAPAMNRLAGAHRRGVGGLRQQHRAELRQHLKELHLPTP